MLTHPRQTFRCHICTHRVLQEHHADSSLFHCSSVSQTADVLTTLSRSCLSLSFWGTDHLCSWLGSGDAVLKLLRKQDVVNALSQATSGSKDIDTQFGFTLRFGTVVPPDDPPYLTVTTCGMCDVFWPVYRLVMRWLVKPQLFPLFKYWEIRLSFFL